MTPEDIEALIKENVRVRVEERQADYYNSRSKRVTVSLHWGDEREAFSSDSIDIIEGEAYSGY